MGMNEDLKDVVGFVVLGILGVVAVELLKVNFQNYATFVLTGGLYLLYRIYEESK